MADRGEPAQADPGAVLVELAPALARLQNEVLGALDPRLTFRQYRLLKWIADGRDTPTALKKVTTLSLATLSVSIDTMVGRGLLQRAPDPGDARRRAVSLTESGAAAIAQGDAAMAALAAELVAELPKRLRPDVGTGLHRVLRRVQRRLSDGPEATGG